MAFQENGTLSNQDSKVRVNVETLARINISDIEYLLEKTELENDSRLKRILYEAAVNKLGTVFQLVMKSLKYLEQHERLREIRESTKDKTESGIAAVSNYRADLFHDGINFLDKDIFYPFGKVSGKGFVAIRVSKEAKLTLKGLYEFSSTDNEFAITSEGIFEISYPSELSEKWTQIDPIPSLTLQDLTGVRDTCNKALAELKEIWHELYQLRKAGDGVHEYSYLNEGGSWELIEKKEGNLNTFKAETKELHIHGELTVTPSDKLRVEGDKIIYEATTEIS